MKLHKGDEVIITAGKDKGKKAVIEKVLIKSSKVLLPGLNMYKRHMKKREGQHAGGIISIARPLPVGNVAFICKKCGKDSRLGYNISNGGKERICKKCNAVV